MSFLSTVLSRLHLVKIYDYRLCVDRADALALSLFHTHTDTHRQADIRERMSPFGHSRYQMSFPCGREQILMRS